MAKPFKSLNTLLRLMRSRNISIDKEGEGSKVKRILSRENYYSVINGYKDIFLDIPAYRTKSVCKNPYNTSKYLVL